MASIDDTRRLFGEQGYVVMPAAVSDVLLEAANERVDQLLLEEPLPAGHHGLHTQALQLLGGDPLLASVIESFAFPVAESMVQPRDVYYPTRCQVVLHVPPDPQQPSGPVLDGLAPLEADGRPGTYSMLLGVFLTDQDAPDMGNIWVWPGTHIGAAAYLTQHGAEKLATSAPYPPINLPEPVQVLGKKNDIFIAHYLLGRAPAANLSGKTSRMVYFRLTCDKHKRIWQQAVTDPFFEFEAVRKAMDA